MISEIIRRSCRNMVRGPHCTSRSHVPSGTLRGLSARDVSYRLERLGDYRNRALFVHQGITFPQATEAFRDEFEYRDVALTFQRLPYHGRVVTVAEPGFLKDTAGRVSRWRRATVAGAMAALVMGFGGTASAQAQVTVTGGVDVPTLYYFRGVRQEVDPKLTIQPFVDVGAALFKDGAGVLKSVNVNVGTWNSIHTGSNNDDFDGPFYESRIYATLTLGFGQLALAATYTAYTYPAPEFFGPGVSDAIHEIGVKGTYSHKWSPYGYIAFELAEDNPGTYLELGVGPSFPLTSGAGGPTLTVPVRLAFDLKDFYGFGEKFGYFGVGGTVVIPRGKWSIKLAGDLLMLSEGLETINVKDSGETSKVGLVGLVGIGFSLP